MSDIDYLSDYLDDEDLINDEVIDSIIDNYVDSNIISEDGNGKLTKDLIFIVATSRAITNSFINLNLIARKLKLDDVIVGKKMINVIIEGSIKTKIKPKNKMLKKQKKRADFSNQLTLIINLYNIEPLYTDDPFYNRLLKEAIERRRTNNIINGKDPNLTQLNLKIFGNGKIMITGGLTIKECEKAVEIFQNASSDLEDYLEIDTTVTLNDLFYDVQHYSKYLKKYYLHFLKLFIILEIDIDLNIDLIMNKKSLEKYEISNGVFKNINGYSINETIDILISGSKENIKKYSDVIQAFNIIHLYYPEGILLDKLKASDKEVIDYIIRLYNGEKILFPITFTKDLFTARPEMSIQNYNTMFSTTFNIDRDELTNIINRSYISDNMSPARFDPSTYQGIKSKYISRIGCNSACSSSGSKKSKTCCCKELTFLIFQNKIIVTGGRLWDQLIDGYTHIKNIIEKEYKNIKIPEDNFIKRQHEPAVFESNGITYLNKYNLIYENPRNYYILKQLKLI